MTTYRAPAAIALLGLALGGTGPLLGHDADADSPRPEVDDARRLVSR